MGTSAQFFHGLKLGAAGYLPKSAASTELELAITTVLAGEKYVSPELSRKMFLDHAKDNTEVRDLANGIALY